MYAKDRTSINREVDEIMKELSSLSEKAHKARYGENDDPNEYGQQRLKPEEEFPLYREEEDRHSMEF